MRSITHVWLLALLSLLFLHGVVDASPPRIEQVEIGLPGPRGTVSRNGRWVPVYLRLKGGSEGNTQNAYEIVVETVEFEEAPYHYSTPVPALNAGEQRVVISYVHPGSASADISVRLKDKDTGQVIQELPRINQGTNRSETLTPRHVLFLALGSKLHPLRITLEEIDKKRTPQGQKDNSDRVDQQRLSYIEDVERMPDRWFGYECVDVVILTTSNGEFVGKLLEPGAAPQRNALLDWVRRGGRLVLSVGDRQADVARLLPLMPLIDCALTEKVQRDRLPLLSEWSQAGGNRALRGRVEVAQVEPGPGVSVLVRERVAPGGIPESPLLLEGSCGLGRVLLLACDVDTKPFSDWPGQQAFWTRLHKEISPKAPLPQTNPQLGGMPVGYADELSINLKSGLETFQEIPVISFGWVALFILLYIVVVGPLDYFILKKLFKKLELTWITFPAVVIVMSLGAYFLAYFVKGDDLRINKIDLIEYDLHGSGQVYGTTWFTIFSPRMQTYTLTVEPAAPAWARKAVGGPAAPTVMSILEGEGESFRTGSQSLFQKPYAYGEDASSLRGIPIPVWATESFTGSWRGALPREGKLPIEVDLRASRARDGTLSGSITNHLPVELQGLTLFYRGRWYSLGQEPLGPEERRLVEPIFEGIGAGKPISEWLNGSQYLHPMAPSDPSGHLITRAQLDSLTSSWAMKRVMFYEASQQPEPANSGLRRFDQSWRLQARQAFQPGQGSHREEAIIVGRAPLFLGSADDLTAKDQAPTRLWLGALPEGEDKPPSVPGEMFQETYLRLYVPVKNPLDRAQP
jgi:hypothetical protein